MEEEWGQSRFPFSLIFQRANRREAEVEAALMTQMTRRLEGQNKYGPRKGNSIRRRSLTVWLDWTIFENSWAESSLQK